MKLSSINLGTFTRQSINALAALRPEQSKAEALVLNELVVNNKVAPLDLKLMVQNGYVVVVAEFKDDRDTQHTEPMFELIGTAEKVMELVQGESADSSERVRQVIERAISESIEGLHDADYLMARKVIALHSPIRVAETPAHLRGFRRIPGLRPMCNLDLSLSMIMGDQPIHLPPDSMAVDDYILQIGPKTSSLRVSRDAA